MNEKTTQLLLATVAALLAIHLVMSLVFVRTARAGEEPAVQTVLRARMIELVDERGRTRVSFRTAPDGEVVFRMMDAGGTIRVKLGASEEGSGMLLLDDETEPGVHMRASRKGTTFTLAEKGKEARIFKP